MSRRPETPHPLLPGEPDPPPAFRLGFAAGVAAMLSMFVSLLYFAASWIGSSAGELQAPRVIEPVLRSAHGDAVMVLTAQQETRRLDSSWPRLQPLMETVLHVDLWRFDSRTAQPVWRRRLLTEREGSIANVKLLGAEGARLWVFLKQPLVLSIADGSVLADAAEIEARNSALKGVLPRELRHYSFYPGYGIAFTAADARAWRIDARTLGAESWQPKTAARNVDAIAPTYFAAYSRSFQKRGMEWPGHWLGVLTDDEAAALMAKPVVPGARKGERRGVMAEFLEANQAPPELDHSGPKRFRAWQATVRQVSRAPAGWSKELPDNWGTRPQYSRFEALPSSAEYLAAGLLSDGRSEAPLWLRGPDSVLVLHRDRIDSEGRSHLARVAGPDGRAVWNAPLTLSIVQSVMPGAESLALFGRAYEEPRRDGSDPSHNAHEVLVAVDLKTGAVWRFDITAADADAAGGKMLK